jgi:hypothetical protein
MKKDYIMEIIGGIIVIMLAINILMVSDLRKDMYANSDNIVAKVNHVQEQLDDLPSKFPVNACIE